METADPFVFFKLKLLWTTLYIVMMMICLY